MAPTLVSQHGFGDNATGATTAITPAGVGAGNTLVLWFASGAASGGAMASVTDTGGNTWTLPDPPRGGTTSSNTYIAAAYVHNAVAPGTITVTHASQSGRLLKLVEISDVSGTPDVATEDFTTAVGTLDMRSAAGTTTAAGDFLVGACHYASGATYPTGAGGGFTLLTEPAATGGRLPAAYKVGGAAGAEQALFTGVTGTALRWGGGLLGFKAKKHGSDTGALSIGTAATATKRKRGKGTAAAAIATAVAGAGRKRGLTAAASSILTAIAAVTRKRGAATVSLSIGTSLAGTTRKRGRTTVTLAIGTTLTGSTRKRSLAIGPLTIQVALAMTGGQHVDLDFPPERGGIVPAASRGGTVAATTRGGYVPPDDRGHE